MRKRHVLLRPPGAPSPGVGALGLLPLLLLVVGASLLGPRALAVCPSACSCSPGHREVDCSWRGLRQLPDGLQHNLHSLNLSHNRFHDLDGRLTPYAHLRLLDLSHNRLGRLPAALPRALWELRAAANRIRLLEKNDTAYQWNLRLLDLSANKLERAVFINNTLTGLRLLNLSHNRFWTVPTNMPSRLVSVDLSHNSLVQVLPGSLDRLPQLTHLYLHANRFSRLGLGALGRLASLRLVTLGENPWACWDHANITHLLAWLQHTPARVLGCPCHTRPVCGEARPARTGGWHFASYTLPPLAASPHGGGLGRPAPQGRTTGWWHLSEAALHTGRVPGGAFGPSTPSAHFSTDTTDSPLTTDRHFPTDRLFLTDKPWVMGKPLTTDPARTTDTAFSTEQSHTTTDPSRTTDTPWTTDGLSTPVSTRRTTTLRTRSVRRPNKTLPSGVRNASPAPDASSPHRLPLGLGLLTLSLSHVL